MQNSKQIVTTNKPNTQIFTGRVPFPANSVKALKGNTDCLICYNHRTE